MSCIDGNCRADKQRRHRRQPPGQKQQPTDRYYQTDERDVLNFSLTYLRDAWEVQLVATNIADELYLEGAGNVVLYGDPRVGGVH